MGTQLGRQTKPDLKVGICGEHGGEPSSVAFCDRIENARDLDGRTHQIVDHRVDRGDRLGPGPLRGLQLRSLGHPALAPDDPAHATQLVGQALAPIRQAVERLRHVAHDTALLCSQPHARLSVPR